MSKLPPYTPAFDRIADDLGIIPAVVFGVVWRFCQMDSGTCTASQNTIAERAGIRISSARTQLGLLVKSGYLNKEIKTGIGITYTDTGKVMLPLQNLIDTPPNFDAHPSKICSATPPNFDDKDSSLRDSLRDSLRCNPEDIFSQDVQAVVGLTGSSNDAIVMLEWFKSGVTIEDVKAALQWRGENGKRPVKTISALAGGVETSRLKRIQGNGNHKQPEGNMLGL